MLKDNRKMNASVKGLLALLIKIQTDKGSKTIHFKLPQPKEENLVSSLVKAFGVYFLSHSHHWWWF
ncbi:hypothetical protein DUHN25_13980 [Helicobacter pylori]